MICKKDNILNYVYLLLLQKKLYFTYIIHITIRFTAIGYSRIMSVECIVLYADITVERIF